MSHVIEQPLGGRILTRGYLGALAVALAALGFVLVRLFTGLGTLTAMSDGYAWGIWKPLNVVTFTGIGAGAFAMGILCYVLNRGEYHPLVRAAVLTGAIAYTLAGFSVVVDLGRWWNLWVVFWPPMYNLNSVLLEVAICVMAYCAVLWVEVTPSVLERLETADNARVRHFAWRLLPGFRRAMPWIIALAIVLPAMHQSSLGGLFMVTPTKLHALWHTPFLPLLFLVSCAVMGYGAVVVLETLTSLVWHRRRDDRLLARVSLVASGLMFAYVAIRMGDLAWSGKLGLVFTEGKYSGLFLAEMALFLYPAIRLLSRRYRTNPGHVFGAAQLALWAGAAYRFDTYLTAFNPGPGFTYFPSVGEIFFSLGLVAIGTSVYVVLVKRVPILSGVLPERVPVRAVPARAARPRAAPARHPAFDELPELAAADGGTPAAEEKDDA